MTKLCSFTLDVLTIEKLDWIVKNTQHGNKSAFVDRLIEREFIALKALKEED